MAPKDKKGTQGKGEQDKPAGAMADLPAGFDSVNPVGNAPWVKPHEGGVVQGILVGHFAGKFGPYYQVRLTQPTVAEDREGNEIPVKAGDLINLNENKAVERLAEYEPNTVEVYVKYIEKIDIGGGKTFWSTSVGAKKLVPATDKPPF